LLERAVVYHEGISMSIQITNGLLLLDGISYDLI
jgi:hypothetical protein